MTVAPVSSFPLSNVGAFLPPASPQGLSDDESRTIGALSNRLSFQTAQMQLSNTYYEGLQRLYDLGVTIPAQLSRVRTVVDWPRICIDPLVQRAVVDGFRLPNATDVDTELGEFWQANDMDAEAPLCYLDALVYGRSYMIVGTGDSGAPLITVESPLNMTLAWDPRTRATTAAYQAYEAEGIQRAALYLPNVSIFMSRDAQASDWVVDNRDEHNFGEVCVVRFANRQRAADREGRSEITPAIRNTTDSACRSLLGMEIAREFYSVPHRYGLGLTESDFVNPDGTSKTALEMTMSKFVAFERDEDGNLPQVGQFQAFDPSVFTKIIDKHAQLMSSYTGFPPAYFGETTTANPASADAIRVGQDGLWRRAVQVQQQFDDPNERVARLSWRVANGGKEVPPEMLRLVTDWVDARPQTPSATTDSIVKQIQAGSIPATSDVTLAELGWNAVQRSRLEQDRKLDAGAAILAELSQSLQAREARTDLTVARDVSGPTQPATAGAGSAGQPGPGGPSTGVPAARPR